ncbi:primary-amine oxidase [Acidiphilium sp. AL]|uniref:Amine oxidase n=2 Tax=Acidiphilium TaxID=522 RepID=A0ABS9E146_9PROT|nr:primary-amine oxidase [Acidiphilium iwatense]MCF3948639.1 primary-amine oxidase [Acidiphilium iwatense]MCU4161776.1 primary-amine oxidase [Acidiphilium sp. AL]
MDDVTSHPIKTETSQPKAESSVLHPLDPLTPAEIQTVVAAVRASPDFGPGIMFEMIELLEPSKAALRIWCNGAELPPRAARVNVFRNDEAGVWRLTVTLSSMRIDSKYFVPGAQPMIQLEQFMAIENIVRSDPDFIAACARRGITDMSLVCVDPWSGGNFNIEGEEGRLLSHTFCWLRTRQNDNLYAHPIAGLNAVVDIKAGRVLRVDDHCSLPIPMAEFNYESQFREDFRKPLKPLDVVQTEGPSFNLEGNSIAWDKWSLVIGFNAREAITLHDIRYDGRSVIHRASLAEMVVPYGSPEPGHVRKNVFDIGEYGLGKLANSLKLGCDCLGHIAYLDAHLNTMTGNVYTIENAICIHEEDSGILWKHWDFRTDRAEIRRGRRLVISCICTVGNYEYATYWYFRQDGSIEFEMKATGIINTTACIPGRPSRFGAEVAPGVEGHVHQHIFCARLDMAIDGERNSVLECDTEAVPTGPANPYGNAFFVTERTLRTEIEGARRADPARQRYWKIINPHVVNHVGKPVGYRLEPTHTITPFLASDSPSARRSGFIKNHLWVTAFNPDERYPAGEFMNHSDGRGGIEDFIAQNRPIADAEIVLWHVLGLHHLPRTEDFPVQPCISAGFTLMPSGFFDQNPALDLPPDINRASRRHSDATCCHH